MIDPGTDLIKRESVAQMVEAFNAATFEVREAYAVLERAQQRLQASFGESYGFETCPRDLWGVGQEAANTVLDRIKPAAWRVIAEKMQMRRVLSIKAREDLDKQLADGKQLPELSVENVLGMFQAMTQNLEVYISEAVKEVHEFLRPHRAQHKTNTELEVGRKVILTWSWVRYTYNGTYEIEYRKQQHARALDNVFSMLDGKGTIESHNGPLSDAVGASGREGKGETEYFRFKCYGNGNLHLEFKRLDLLDKLNAVAGGMTLKACNEQAEAKAKKPAPPVAKPARKAPENAAAIEQTLRARWTEQGVSQDRQTEILQGLFWAKKDAPANPVATAAA